MYSKFAHLSITRTEGERKLCSLTLDDSVRTHKRLILYCLQRVLHQSGIFTRSNAGRITPMNDLVPTWNAPTVNVNFSMLVRVTGTCLNTFVYAPIPSQPLVLPGFRSQTDSEKNQLGWDLPRPSLHSRGCDVKYTGLAQPIALANQTPRSKRFARNNQARVCTRCKNCFI